MKIKNFIAMMFFGLLSFAGAGEPAEVVHNQLFRSLSGEKDYSHVMGKWREDFDDVTVEDMDLVEVDLNALIDSSFVVELFTGVRFEVKNAELNNVGGVQCVNWVDYDAQIFVNLRYGKEGLKGDIHVGFEDYMVRPEGNGKHGIFLTSTDQGIDEAYQVPQGSDKSIWFSWFRGDLWGLGKDGLGRLTWTSSNNLEIKFDRDLNGSFDTVRNFRSTLKPTLGAWTTAEFGDWDGNGRDGMLMAWYDNGVTKVEFYRDYTPCSYCSNYRNRTAYKEFTGYYNQLLAGTYNGPGPCDADGDSLTFFHPDTSDSVFIYRSCRNPLNLTSGVHPKDSGEFGWSYLQNNTLARMHVANVDGSGISEYLMQLYDGVSFRYSITGQGTWTYRYGLSSDEMWLWGDWYGSPNGKDTAAVYRNGQWWINYNLDGYNDVIYP